MPYADPAIKRAADRYYAATKRADRRIADRVSKPFVGWDGEGYTAWVVDSNGIVYPNCHRYILFGNTAGSYITGPNLETVKIFEYLLEHGSKTAGKVINISFAFDYDVNMIIGDVDERAVRRLRKTGHCYWRGYRIEHRPHKWVQLSRRNKDSSRTSIRIYDIFAFFGGAFTKACASYLGESERLRFVAAGKARRASFSYAHLSTEIIPYWIEEGKLLVELANALRLSINSAGLYISQWHGPGALATALFQKYHYKDYISEIPEDVNRAARYAYSSGRFEPFRGGLYTGPVWIADIHNAYPYAFSRLPPIAKGQWEYLGSEDAERALRQSHGIALYNIRLEGNGHDYQNSTLRSMPMPLFYRNQANRISYPVRVEGWYHEPDAAAAAFLFKERCKVLGAWILHDVGGLPFAWLEQLYYERQKLKAEGNSAEKAIKLAANATTGKAAQRIGWNEEKGTAPTYHCLEYAGAITSKCREMVLMAAIHANRDGGLISIDTDGVISTSPFQNQHLPNGIGPNLGQWEISEYTGILYIQNGVYWLRDGNGNWLPPKSRGIPQSQLDFEQCYRQYNAVGRLNVTQHQFVGYGAALHGQWEEWRTWRDRPREFIFGGNGKRVHSPKLCLQCGTDPIPESLASTLHNFVIRNPGGGISSPHNLPWIDDVEDDPDRPWEIKRWDIIDDEQT